MAVYLWTDGRVSTMTLNRVAEPERQSTNGGKKWKRAAGVKKSREKTEQVDEEEKFES